ncbi:hypothetical protein D3C71_1943250 [compost metagenome]
MLEWHEDRGESCCRHLTDRQRTGAADHDICPGIGAGHVIDKFRHPMLRLVHTGIVLINRFQRALTHLVPQADALAQ